MKMLSAGRVSLLGVVLASNIGVSDAVRETLSVSEGGVDFTVVSFSDDRNRPHRLRFPRTAFSLSTRSTGVKK